MEEIPLLEKVIKEQRDADKQFFEEQEKERVRVAHSTHVGLNTKVQSL